MSSTEYRKTYEAGESNFDYDQLFCDGGPYHIESLLIWSTAVYWTVNEWTGFYMMETSDMKKLIKLP